MDAQGEGGEGVAKHEQKLFILGAIAHGDERGVVARRRLSAKREALSGTSMIESGAYIYQNKSIHMPDPPINSRNRRKTV